MSHRLITSPKQLFWKLEQEYEGKRILEIGCGNKKIKGAIGIDVRENSLADIHHDLNKFPWPIEDSQFDLIICRHVLEHLPETDKVMEEIYRIAKPNAKFAIEVPHFSYVEAYRHWQHCHFFTAGSFDYFHPDNKVYKCRFEIERKRFFFSDFFSKTFGVEFFANRFTRFYERHLAFIFPACVIYFELIAIK